MAGYLDAVTAIKDYYAGTGQSDLWLKIVNDKALTQADIEAIKKVPFVTANVANDGSILNWTYDADFAAAENFAGTINSNAQVAEYGSASTVTKTKINATATQSAGKTTLTSGASKVSTGTKVASVANKAFMATAAVAAATWLGKTIDETLYSVNPSWWDEHLPTINPQTWDSIARTEAGKNFINTLFGIEDDDSSQMYIPEEMLALTYMALLSAGAYGGGKTIVSTGSLVQGQTVSKSDFTVMSLSEALELVHPTSIPSYIQTQINNHQNTKVILGSYHNGQPSIICNGTTSGIIGDVNVPEFSTNITNVSSGIGYLSNNVSVASSGLYILNIASNGTLTVSTNSSTTVNRVVDATGDSLTAPLIKIRIETASPLPGVSDTPGATQIDPSLITATDPAGVLTQLKSNYPSLFDGSVRDTVLQDDGTVKNRDYVPVPYIKDKEQPTTGDQTQLDPKVNPEDPSSEELVQDLIIKTDPVDPEPVAPDTGTGDSPTVVTPTGSASSLWAVYNPTQAQVDAFGAWLWSSNLVDQIKKLFNDPMQAIIGVHKVFATPATGAAQNIKVGYLDSGVSSAVVTDQYTTIDCGTVNVREYYGNVLDYAPLTEISLFLPFIGIVKLDPADVMRGAVSVKYRVDVITGACLAEVRVNRDTFNPVMYTYAGSAIVSYPISSGSYASAVTGALSIAAGVAGTIASGGALAPALIGGALGATHLHANVQHSGSFSGCAGAMGGKKPYLIISRPQSATPYGFETIQGKPAARKVKLSSCDGITKVDSVDLKGITATETELRMIEAALKQGVIV